MSDLNPIVIYNNYQNGKIDKTTASNYLISIIEHPQKKHRITTHKAYHAKRSREASFRINAIRILGEIGIKNKEVFELLEGIIISERSRLTFVPAAKAIILNFLDKCVEPLRWVIQNTKSTQKLAIILDLVWGSDILVFNDLKNELYEKLGDIIQKHVGEGLIFEEAIALTLLEQFTHDFEKINYDQDTEEILYSRDAYCIYKTNQDGYVIEIHSSQHGFNYVPESISKLKYLKVFSSMGGELSWLPETIGQLQYLEVLNLLANSLTKLPESIGNLKCLKELMVNGNYLQSLPNSIGNLKNLTKLSAERNKITELPESIGKLESLKFLNLGGNKIEYIPHSIITLKKLETLILVENNIKNKPEFIQDLVPLTKLSL